MTISNRITLDDLRRMQGGAFEPACTVQTGKPKFRLALGEEVH